MPSSSNKETDVDSVLLLLLICQNGIGDDELEPLFRVGQSIGEIRACYPDIGLLVMISQLISTTQHRTKHEGIPPPKRSWHWVRELAFHSFDARELVAIGSSVRVEKEHGDGAAQRLVHHARERTVGAATTTEKQTNERERKPFLFLLKINNLSSSNKKGEKNQMAADALVVMTTLSSRWTVRCHCKQVHWLFPRLSYTATADKHIAVVSVASSFRCWYIRAE